MKYSFYGKRIEDVRQKKRVKLEIKSENCAKEQSHLGFCSMKNYDTNRAEPFNSIKNKKKIVVWRNKILRAVTFWSIETTDVWNVSWFISRLLWWWWPIYAIRVLFLFFIKGLFQKQDPKCVMWKISARTYFSPFLKIGEKIYGFFWKFFKKQETGRRFYVYLLLNVV